jgi:hypothetical protein
MALTQEQFIKELSKHFSDCGIYAESRSTVRLDIPTNNVALRDKTTEYVVGLFKGATTVPQRPHDVLLPGGQKILVKPAKGAKKTGSAAYYGILAQLDLKTLNTSAFKDVCATFTGGNLVQDIKEASDVKGVGDLNKVIEKAMGSQRNGVTLTLAGYRFEGVIGCVPVTNGEPKSDFVLVCRKGNVLEPGAQISYKLGTSAKDFQGYSGLSQKSSPYIFNHEETEQFFTTLQTLSDHGEKGEPFQVIKDKEIIGKSVWGMDYPSSEFGINNVHCLAQGEARLAGTALTYNHITKNGDFNFDKSYQPVFGARYASGRNNKGPRGLTANNFRIGIFPRAYRQAWMK